MASCGTMKPDGHLNEAMLVGTKHPAAHRGEYVGWGSEVHPIEGFVQPWLRQRD